MSIGVLFIVLALIAALCATAGIPASRINLLALAFALFLVGLLVGGVSLHG